MAPMPEFLQQSAPAENGNIAHFAAEIRRIQAQMTVGLGQAEAAAVAALLADRLAYLPSNALSINGFHADLDNLIDDLEMFRALVVAAAAKHDLLLA